MSEENKTLNKGLDALLGQSNTNQRSVKEIEISKIKPGRFQPRSNFDNEKLQELTESIKKQGVLSPILVRELGLNEYEVIAGERRLRASKIAGLDTMPCLVKEVSDQDAAVLGIVENVQRSQLNTIEEALGYKSLQDNYGLSASDIGLLVGKSVSLKERLLNAQMRCIMFPTPYLTNPSFMGFSDILDLSITYELLGDFESAIRARLIQEKITHDQTEKILELVKKIGRAHV